MSHLVSSQASQSRKRNKISSETYWSLLNSNPDSDDEDDQDGHLDPRKNDKDQLNWLKFSCVFFNFLYILITVPMQQRVCETLILKCGLELLII